MMTLRRILFPTDFSLCAERAFGHAARLADHYGATLHVLHVVEPSSDLSDGLTSAPLLEEDDLAEQLHVALGTPARRAEDAMRLVQAQRHGDAAAPAILDYASTQAIDLIVMGTHGRRGVSRLLLGSVAEEVLRQAACPVLTVRGEDKPAAQRRIDSVLVPVDFSEHSRVALRHAYALATAYDAPLEVIHVVEEMTPPPFYGFEVAMPPPEDVERHAARALRRVIEDEVPEPDRVQLTVTAGHPAAEVLTYAEAHRTGLIVMGTHGRSGVAHFLMGSVAERVVRRAPCPVFTVKSFAEPVPAAADVDEGEAP